VCLCWVGWGTLMVMVVVVCGLGWQEGHGGWADQMAALLGRNGKVDEVSQSRQHTLQPSIHKISVPSPLSLCLVVCDSGGPGR
jgi:hypothetical protein